MSTLWGGERGRKRGEKEERKDKGEEKGKEGRREGGRMGGREERRRRKQGGEKKEERREGGDTASTNMYMVESSADGVTYSEQPCYVRCMSSIHAPSRAWHTLTRLGGKRRELW